MTDDDVMTAVREPFAAMRMATPLETIVARGRARRRRRRVPAIVTAGAAAAAIAVGVAAAVAPPAGPGAALSAWTVSTRPGVVTVTVREMQDPAGLQHTLRADGVPAIVDFGRVAVNTHCGSVPRGDLLNKIFTSGPYRGGSTLVHIHLAAIPDGVALAFSFFKVEDFYTTATGAAWRRLAEAEEAKMPPGVTAFVYQLRPGQPVPPHPAGPRIDSAMQLLTTSGQCLG
jgi:hypothetical protein